MDSGKLLIAVGMALLCLGLVIRYAPWLIDWFGRLPGDIRIENPNSRIFVPITSMVIVSIILTLIVNFWFRK